MDKNYVVMLEAKEGNVLLITPDGKPMSQAAAQRLADKYRKSTFRILSAMPMAIQSVTVATAPLIAPKPRR